MPKIVFRDGNNYDSDAVSLETGISCPDESLALQSAEEESNINTIVRRFGLTGQLPDSFAMPQSGDFTNIPDFHTAMNIIRTTQQEFLKVPADVRARFGNDPQAFMMFLEDENNRAEAARLGLLRPAEPAPQPTLVKIVPDGGTPPSGAAAG